MRLPARLLLVIFPLATGAALVAYIVARISLDLGIALLAALGLAVGIIIWTRAQTPSRVLLKRRALIGVTSGVVATGAYDLVRWAFVTVFGLGFRPFDVIPIFGQLLLGRSSLHIAQVAIGIAYHWANGIGFAAAYVLVVAHPRVLTALIWAACLELAMVSIYPGWLHIRAIDEFYFVSVLGHLTYGCALGVVSRRLLSRGAA